MMIPYGKHRITAEDILAVREVLDSRHLTQGDLVPKFEKELSRTCGAGAAVAANSATSCLHIACLALGVGPGDIVWTSPNSFVASSNCALYCGASVNFVDIDPVTGLIDENELERRLKEAMASKSLPKVIIPVHFAGASCNMQRIYQVCRNFGVKIIEDASHSIGGKYRDVPCGSCKYSDITVFSFHPVKIITTGEGGAALTNDSSLAKKMKLLREHGIAKDRCDFEERPNGPWVYEQQVLGFNYRMTEIQAALGLSQLRRLTQVVHERNEIYLRYVEMIRDDRIRLLRIPDDCMSSVHLVVMSLMGDTGKKAHRKIFEGMRKAGIGVQVHYSPIHLQPYYKRQGFKAGDFEHAEDYAQRSFSLPVYPGLSIEEQGYVVRNLTNLVGAYS